MTVGNFVFLHQKKEDLAALQFVGDFFVRLVCPLYLRGREGTDYKHFDKSWMRVAEDRARWRAIGETCLVEDCCGLMMMMKIIEKTGSRQIRLSIGRFVIGIGRQRQPLTL
jgi:hypothetical protein